MENTASPYDTAVPQGATDARIPDKERPRVKGEGVPSPEVLRNFIAAASKTDAAIEGRATTDVPLIRYQEPDGKITTGPLFAAKEESTTQPLTPEQIMAKVTLFLDNKMRTPITVVGPIRHKLFVLKIPTQQEMIDVSSFTGSRIADGTNDTAVALNVIGELLKACMGWIPERSPNAHVLRENIIDPEKWPPIRRLTWLSSIDPYIMDDEAVPLWNAYQAWRKEVVPTKDEMDFYYANQT